MWLSRTDVLPMLAIVGGGAIGASLTVGLLLAPNDPVRAPVQATSTPTAVRPARPPNAPRRPVWSPDGQWIVYQSDASGESQVYIRRLDGKDGPLWVVDGVPIDEEAPRVGN